MGSLSSWSSRVSVAVLTVLAVSLVSAAAAGAGGPRPDLTASLLRGPAPSLTAGTSVTLRVRVRNIGSAGARASRLLTALSRDRTLDTRDVRLGAQSRVRSLTRRGTVTLGVTSLIPRTIAPATYRLLACADGGRRVRELRETNNCAVSGPIRVAAPPTSSKPGGPPTPPPNGPVAAPDVPDPQFLDTDGDGIDGQASAAVFVRPGGADGAGCGTTASPCGTPQGGVDRAAALGRSQVYLAGGAYPAGLLHLADGISVYGGFGQNFQRNPASATGDRQAVLHGAAATTVFQGSPDAAAAVRSAGLRVPTVLADVTIAGADATAPGASAYGIVATDIPAGVLTIARVTINAGDGAPGGAGGAGADATSTAAADAMKGAGGGAGVEASVTCDVTSRGTGGPAGVGPTPAQTGGTGGAGGTMDTTCTAGICSNCNATPGLAGLAASTTALPDLGQPGAGGPANSGGCDGGSGTPGQDGRPGKVTNGAGGAGGAGGGLLSGGAWRGRPGAAGDLGAGGTGGGGGGGGGGCDDGTDAYGAGGGGGGAGGTPALGAGGAGEGGGGSFGVYLVNAAPAIVSSTIQRGAGGTGGVGGTGGRGQDGGTAGSGGLHPGASPAGRGGDGAHGGHAGGGGGGGGGISYGVWSATGPSASIGGDTVISGGQAGAGGSGGVSAPTAGGPLDDGQDGAAGAAGSLGSVGSCASLMGCA